MFAFDQRGWLRPDSHSNFPSWNPRCGICSVARVDQVRIPKTRKKKNMTPDMKKNDPTKAKQFFEAKMAFTTCLKR